MRFHRTDKSDAPARAREAETAHRKHLFLTAFEECGRVTKAAQIARINRCTHYDWHDRDPEYARAFQELRDRIVDVLEDEAIRRAVEGVDRPLIGRVAKDKDGVITTFRHYSDSLLILLLRANCPQRYSFRSERKTRGATPSERQAPTREEIVAEIERLQAVTSRREQMNSTGRASESAAQERTAP